MPANDREPLRNIKKIGGGARATAPGTAAGIGTWSPSGHPGLDAPSPEGRRRWGSAPLPDLPGAKSGNPERLRQGALREKWTTPRRDDPFRGAETSRGLIAPPWANDSEGLGSATRPGRRSRRGDRLPSVVLRPRAW